MQKHTVSIAFVRAAVDALSPVAAARALDRAGISPELLGVPAARVSARAFAALWLAVARELDDEFFGLDTRRMKVGSFALLCQAVVHCGTIGHALKRCLRTFSVFLDDIDGVVRVEQGEAVVRLTNRIADPERRRFADETFLVMVHGLICWLAGRRIPLLAAEFAWPRPGHADEYRIMFSQRLAFGAPQTCVRFDAKVLGAPVVQDESTLKRFLRSAPQSVFIKYRDQDSWTARLRRRLRGSGEAGWPTLDEVAGELGVPASTLRRRLEAEGTTFQAIKDQLRRDIAIHHLSEGDMSVGDIAARLGFQDASAFYRAFRRWTGSQPGAYRSRHFT